MELSNQFEKNNIELNRKELDNVNKDNRLKRMINRYLDLSCAFVRLHEEKEGFVYDRMLNVESHCDHHLREMDFALI